MNRNGDEEMNFLENIKRKMSEKKIINSLDEILSEEKMKEYFKQHPFINDKYLNEWIKENTSMQVDSPSYEDIKRMWTFIFSIEYYKKKYKKEPETASDFVLYYYFIYKNIESFCNIVLHQ